MKTLKRWSKNEKGLTLIELLAVIVILGIIAAIAVPSIGGIINKTKDDAVKAEAIQIIEAAKLYMATASPLEAGSPKELTAEELDIYLDNVKDPDYTVEVTVGEKGKYVYTLKNHGILDLDEYTGYKNDGITLEQINNP